MGTTLIGEPISTQKLREAGEELYGDMVKAVVDIEKGVMAEEVRERILGIVRKLVR
jgi:hypothetical protein